MSDVQKNTPLRSRRQILKILAIGSAAGLMSGLGIRGRSRNPAVTRSRSLMGTVVNLTVIGDDGEAAEAAVTATLGRMSELESRLSRYRPESEVSRLNRTGRIENASDELLELLRLSDRISCLGEGASVTRPSSWRRRRMAPVLAA